MLTKTKGLPDSCIAMWRHWLKYLITAWIHILWETRRKRMYVFCSFNVVFLLLCHILGIYCPAHTNKKLAFSGLSSRIFRISHQVEIITFKTTRNRNTTADKSFDKAYTRYVNLCESTLIWAEVRKCHLQVQITPVFVKITSDVADEPDSYIIWMFRMCWFQKWCPLAICGGNNLTGRPEVRLG